MPYYNTTHKWRTKRHWKGERERERESELNWNSQEEREREKETTTEQAWKAESKATKTPTIDVTSWRTIWIYNVANIFFPSHFLPPILFLFFLILPAFFSLFLSLLFLYPQNRVRFTNFRGREKQRINEKKKTTEKKIKQKKTPRKNWAEILSFKIQECFSLSLSLSLSFSFSRYYIAIFYDKFKYNFNLI